MSKGDDYSRGVDEGKHKFANQQPRPASKERMTDYEHGVIDGWDSAKRIKAARSGGSWPKRVP